MVTLAPDTASCPVTDIEVMGKSEDKVRAPLTAKDPLPETAQGGAKE
jgi:hypothetical protein